MRKMIIIILVLLHLACTGNSQRTMQEKEIVQKSAYQLKGDKNTYALILSLEQVKRMAEEKSISALKASTAKETSYWQWRTFKSNYRPQLRLDAVLPDLNRTINPITQPDGNIFFQEISNSYSSVDLYLSQGISATGGEIFVASQMQRFDDFRSRVSTYNSYPALIGIRQPVFSFNRLAWDKKIEPLRYEESRKFFNEEMETIGYLTTQLYFEVLQAQIDLKIAQKNFANNDTLLKIAKVKHELGKITRSDILQLELALRNDQKNLAQAKLSYETALLRLNSYIGYTFDKDPELEIPANIPSFAMDERLALSEAKRNRGISVTFLRTLKEAERDVVKAKRDNRLNINLFATFGLTNRANNLPEIYNNINDQQTLRIGINLPVMDWGRAESRIKTAKADQELVKYSVAQEEINFEQEILTQLRQFKMLREQVIITAEADEIANDRYDISKNRYLIGELTLTDLNIAQQEKDQAKRDYIQTIRDFWNAHANLRLLTLYDFEHQNTIDYRIENNY